MKRQLQCLFDWVWAEMPHFLDLTEFQACGAKCVAQPLQAAASGANEQLCRLVILTAHHHSSTQAGSHLWRRPRTLRVPEQGQLQPLLHR